MVLDIQSQEEKEYHKVSGVHWPPAPQIAASIVTTKKPHATEKTLFYYSQYVEKMGCMICKSNEKTSGSGMHSRALTEDGKLVIACTTCRTRQFQDKPEISANDKQRLQAQWKAYVTAKPLGAGSATPQPLAQEVIKPPSPAKDFVQPQPPSRKRTATPSKAQVRQRLRSHTYPNQPPLDEKDDA